TRIGGIFLFQARGISPEEIPRNRLEVLEILAAFLVLNGPTFSQPPASRGGQSGSRVRQNSSNQKERQRRCSAERPRREIHSSVPYPSTNQCRGRLQFPAFKAAYSNLAFSSSMAQ